MTGGKHKVGGPVILHRRDTMEIRYCHAHTYNSNALWPHDGLVLLDCFTRSDIDGQKRAVVHSDNEHCIVNKVQSLRRVHRRYYVHARVGMGVVYTHCFVVAASGEYGLVWRDCE